MRLLPIDRAEKSLCAGMLPPLKATEDADTSPKGALRYGREKEEERETGNEGEREYERESKGKG